MRPICFVVLFLIGLGCGPAVAQSQSDKLCALSLARKMPTVPAGATWGDFTFRATDKDAAVERVLAGRRLEEAVEDLDSVFAFVDDALARWVKIYSDREARKEVAAALQERITDAVKVRAQVKVANITMAYEGTCIRGVEGAVYAHLDGSVQ